MWLVFCFVMMLRPPRSTRTSTLFPCATLCRSVLYELGPPGYPMEYAVLWPRCSGAGHAASQYLLSFVPGCLVLPLLRNARNESLLCLAPSWEWLPGSPVTVPQSAQHPPQYLPNLPSAGKTFFPDWRSGVR